MKYVWLDIKGNEGVFKYLEPVVRDAYSNAAAQGRDIVILTGLPNADVITEFNTQPSYKSGDPSYSYKYKTGDPPYIK